MPRRRPTINRGDEVRIATFIMQPWGWPQYPKIPGMDELTQIEIPDGTRGIAITGSTSNSYGDEGAITVDYVLDDTLYRTLIEAQYVRRVPQCGDEVWDVFVLREPGRAWERFYGFRLTEAEARGDVDVARKTLAFEYPQVVAEARRV